MGRVVISRRSVSENLRLMGVGVIKFNCHGSGFVAGNGHPGAVARSRALESLPALRAKIAIRTPGRQLNTSTAWHVFEP